MDQTKKNQIELSTDGSTIYAENYCALPTSNIKSFEFLKNGSIVFHLIKPIQDDEEIISPIHSYTIDDASIDPETESRLNQILEKAHFLIKNNRTLIIQKGMGTLKIDLECIVNVHQNKDGYLVIQLNPIKISKEFHDDCLRTNPSDGSKTLIYKRFFISQKDLQQLELYSMTCGEDVCLNIKDGDTLRKKHKEENEKLINSFLNQNFKSGADFTKKFISDVLKNNDPEFAQFLINDALKNPPRDESNHCDSLCKMMMMNQCQPHQLLSANEKIRTIVEDAIKLEQQFINQPVPRKVRMGIEWRLNDQYNPSTVSLLITLNDVSGDPLYDDDSGNGLRMITAEQEYAIEAVDEICKLIQHHIKALDHKKSSSSSSIVKDLEIKHIKDDQFLVQFIRYSDGSQKLKSAQEYLFTKDQLENLLTTSPQFNVLFQ